METLGLSHRESIRKEVVLDGGVSLNNVPPLSPHVQVEYLAAAGLGVRQERAGSEFEDVASVLEGPAKLGGIDGETERLVGGGADVDIWVLRDGGADTEKPVRFRNRTIICFNYNTGQPVLQKRHINEWWWW